MVPRGYETVKILGEGDLTKKLVVRAAAFSASAKEKIEKAGGTAELIPMSKPAKAAAAG
jgi:large subunit ribosomal protein L15